jgi:hypothetical protein
MIIKKTQVQKSTNFDAGLYDITTFSETCVFSHQYSDIWISVGAWG